MRFACLVTTVAVAAFAIAPSRGLAQQSSRPTPPGPYKEVPVTLPKPYGDAGLDALRKDLAEIAKRKDRSALAAKVLSKGFFWQREDSNGADPKKSGIDNLAAAIGLDAPDGMGWQALGAYAADPTAAGQPEIKDVVCSPAPPTFNEDEIEKVAEATKTDPSDWSFPTAPTTDVRSKPEASSPVVGKLGMYLVRMIPDDNPSTANADWIKVVTSDGKVGYVNGAALAPLGSDQMCYAKDGGKWSIAGYIGGGGGQE